MSTPEFLEFTSTAGNTSYVRFTAISAIYHDGRHTRIVLAGVYDSPALLASEMPDVLMRQLLFDTGQADRDR